MDALPSTTPPTIVSLIRRCLARDPWNRLRDIGDARLVLVDDTYTTHTVAAGTIAPVFGVPPRDAVSFGAEAVTLLIVVGAAAAYIPARRASKVAPGSALRAD